MIDAEATERFMAAPWLAEVDPETKRAISSALVERGRRPVPPARTGSTNDHLTFLIAGTAEIVRHSGSGRREMITDLTAPAVFGTTSFFQPKPPTVTVKATSDVWILSLYHPAHEALRGQPRAAEASRSLLFGPCRNDLTWSINCLLNSRCSIPTSRRGKASGPRFVLGCSRSVGFRNRAAAAFFRPRIGYEWQQFC